MPFSDIACLPPLQRLKLRSRISLSLLNKSHCNTKGGRWWWEVVVGGGVGEVVGSSYLQYVCEVDDMREANIHLEVTPVRIQPEDQASEDVSD